MVARGPERAEAISSECRAAQRSGLSSRSLGSTLQIVIQSLREGLDAHRRYEELRSKGIPHDAAIRQALGLPRVEP